MPRLADILSNTIPQIFHMKFEHNLSIAAVGQALIQRDLRSATEPRFWAIQKILKAADVSFTNLETTIAGPYGGWPTKSGLTTAAPPSVLDTLSELGINALALSNNHAFDFGQSGILSTLQEVEQRGFLHAGTGRSLAAAARGGVRDINGTRVSLIAMDAGPGTEAGLATNANGHSPARPGLNGQQVASVFMVEPSDMERLRRIKDAIGHQRLMPGYRHITPENSKGSFQHVPHVADDELFFYGLRFKIGAEPSRVGLLNASDLNRNLAAIAEAKANGNFVVAYLHHHHWEPRWEDVPKWVGDFAHQCIDAGADIYLSHGVPMVQGIEIYRDRPIFYSLGNFIFHVPGDPSTWVHRDIWRSVVATCRFKKGAIAEIELAPIVIGDEAALDANDYSYRDLPLLARSGEAEDIIQRIAQRAAAFGTTISFDGNVGRIRI